MCSRIVEALATTVAHLEEVASPHASILPDFPRSIQLDGYSCGAKSVYTILRCYNKHCTPLSVERELQMKHEGTSIINIKRVLKQHRLKYRKIRGLKSAINDGHPALVSLFDHLHYSAIYGYSKSDYFVINPSLGAMGSLRCTVSEKKFRQIWDNWALEIRRYHSRH
jgi:ABC-type bacteriocin/lantibiotic exporter with double-glycine peptidase domain